jgi:hypothetical protein
MKTTNLVLLLVALVTAASFAAWGCGGKSSGDASNNADDDDDNSGGAVAQACNAFVAKCGAGALPEYTCAELETAAADACISTVTLIWFQCLTGTGCTNANAIDACTATYDDAVEECENPYGR